MTAQLGDGSVVVRSLRTDDALYVQLKPESEQGERPMSTRLSAEEAATVEHCVSDLRLYARNGYEWMGDAADHLERLAVEAAESVRLREAIRRLVDAGEEACNFTSGEAVAMFNVEMSEARALLESGTPE